MEEELSLKWCPGQGGHYKPISAFRKRRTVFRHEGVSKNYYFKLCLDCESIKRNKPENRIRVKASQWITRHAPRFRTTREELAKRGITTEYIYGLMWDEWTAIINGKRQCNSCKLAGKKKPCYPDGPVIGTIEEISVDVVDRERKKREGLTGSNLRAICTTANRAKGRIDPSKYDKDVVKRYGDQEKLNKGVQIEIPEFKIVREGNRLRFY